MGIGTSNIHYTEDNNSVFIGSITRKGSGYGKISFSDSSTYIGNIKDNLLNGYGTCQYNDGSIYKGEWRDGVRNGNGVMYFVSGIIYSGNFDIDEMNGSGTFSYQDGTYYKGNVKFGKRVGTGTLYNKNDLIVYTGEWSNDKQLYAATKRQSIIDSLIHTVQNYVSQRHGYGTRDVNDTRVANIIQRPSQIPTQTAAAPAKGHTIKNRRVSPDLRPNTNGVDIPLLDLEKIKHKPIKREFFQMRINTAITPTDVQFVETRNPVRTAVDSVSETNSQCMTCR